MPALQRVPQRKIDRLAGPQLPQLNRCTFNHDRPGFLPGRHLKKMAKKGEMGLNPQIHLAKMDEGGDMKNGVWIQMDELYSVEMQKTPEESTGGNGKTTVEEGFKNHDLIGICGGESFSIGGAPPDDFFLGKNPILHHSTEMILGDGGPLPHLLRRRDSSHWGKARWNRGA